MAPRDKRSQPPREPLVTADPAAAVRRLKSRAAEIAAMRDLSDPDDPRIQIAERNLVGDIRDVFGESSTEFDQYQHHQFWSGNMYVGMHPQAVLGARRGGIADAEVVVASLIARVEERLPEAPLQAARDAHAAFDGIAIHPRLLQACARQFHDGHYREAVLNAGIALVSYVKEKSGSSLDGSSLMTTVFSANTPVLAFNGLTDQTDRDEQQGLMHLFTGAVLALRNPRAHTLSPDTAEFAVEAIAFLSFLAKHLDRARRI